MKKYHNQLHQLRLGPPPILRTFILYLLLFSVLVPHATRAEDHTQLQQGMIDAIVNTAHSVNTKKSERPLNPAVLAAMKYIPRQQFVPEEVQPYAYENRPLPIGYGQTISQPYIVALMTDLLEPESGDRMLEVGTGSGYQAAVLGKLVSEVYTMEIIKPLSEQATRTLKTLGYKNIFTRHADGYYGWEEKGPYDGIIVTAASGQIPPPLVAQLKPGARMIIPVGSGFFSQHLMLVEKDSEGKVHTRQILPVRFVPLTGDH